MPMMTARFCAMLAPLSSLPAILADISGSRTVRARCRRCPWALVDTVGVIERGQIARRQEARDQGVDEEADFDAARADHGSAEGAKKLAHLGAPARQLEAQGKTLLAAAQTMYRSCRMRRETRISGGMGRRGKYCALHRVPIIAMFSRIGEAAAARNLLTAFSMAESWVTIAMQSSTER